MASGYSPAWLRVLHRWTPSLFLLCPGSNLHWLWSRTCRCLVGENNHNPFDYVGSGMWVERPHEVRDCKE